MLGGAWPSSMRSAFWTWHFPNPPAYLPLFLVWWNRIWSNVLNTPLETRKLLRKKKTTLLYCNQWLLWKQDSQAEIDSGLSLGGSHKLLNPFSFHNPAVLSISGLATQDKMTPKRPIQLPWKVHELPWECMSAWESCERCLLARHPFQGTLFWFGLVFGDEISWWSPAGFKIKILLPQPPYCSCVPP